MNQSEITEQTKLYNNAVFFIETEKIKPNPYQPRKEFDQDALRALADSIKMYGVLQPLVVTRREVSKADGGLATEYELIAGERRLRASRLAGLQQVPAVIRVAEHSDKLKLELAIIENIQREDLNPVDRAIAFKQLADTFNLTHAEIGKKVGKSREYVSNTLRLLALPQYILDALSQKKISEGHTRPLLMLSDRPAEQSTLFKEIIYRGLNVRDTELVARRIAHEKTRKPVTSSDPVLVEIEEKMTETLGTRVHIEKRNVGGKIEIDYFSVEDLQKILEILEKNQGTGKMQLGMNEERRKEMEKKLTEAEVEEEKRKKRLDPQGMPLPPEKIAEIEAEEALVMQQQSEVTEEEYEKDKVDFDNPKSLEPSEDSDEDLYSIRNFSV